MGDEVIADKLEGCLPHKSCTKKIAWHVVTVVWLQSMDNKLTSLTQRTNQHTHSMPLSICLASTFVLQEMSIAI